MYDEYIYFDLHKSQFAIVISREVSYFQCVHVDICVLQEKMMTTNCMDAVKSHCVLGKKRDNGGENDCLTTF